MDTPLYLGNVLSSFETGVQLDLRVKMALDLLKAGVPDTVLAEVRVAGAASQVKEVRLTAKGKASYALEMAEALVDEAKARGLVKDLPDDNELTQPMRKHLARNVRAQVYSQSIASQIAAEESPMVRAVPRKSVIEN